MPGPNSVPRFIDVPRTWSVRIPAASPRATPAGGGTTHELLTGDIEGSRIDSFLVQAQSTTEDSLVYVFLETPNNTFFLYDEIQVTATTGGSGQNARFQTEITLTNPITVRKDWKVMVGTNVTNENIFVFATGGDY